MIDKFRLKHLDDIAKDDIDYNKLMSEVFDYRDNWYNRIYHFIKSFKKMKSLTHIVKSLKLKHLEPNPECEILLPDHIDNITFASMMKTQILMGNPGDRSTPELMCELISLVCFSSNVKQKFDTDSLYYRGFKNRVWNASAIDMIGLYNHIVRELDESSKEWSRRFLSVEVDDPDYKEAGGHRMNQFNVITTLKHLCADFNVTEDEAWQLSYSLSQTNSYAKATSAHIQNEMSRIKERKMKQQRK